MIKIYNLINKIEFLEEVATLEYEEWANNKEKDIIIETDKVIYKIEKIEGNRIKTIKACKV